MSHIQLKVDENIKRLQQSYALEAYIDSDEWRSVCKQDTEEVLAHRLKIYNEMLERFNGVCWALDDIVQGSSENCGGDISEVYRILKEGCYELIDEGKELVFDKEFLIEYHSNIRHHILKEVEAIKNKEQIFQSWYTESIKHILAGNVDNLDFSDKFIEEFVNLYYVCAYLDKKHLIDWKSHIPSHLFEVLDQVAQMEFEVILTPLEEYLRNQEHIYNYVEIINELRRGNELPNARHALALHYYCFTRSSSASYLFNLNDALVMKLILTSQDLVQLYKDLFKANSTIVRIHPQIYNDVESWTKAFEQTNDYVSDHPDLVDVLNELLDQDVEHKSFNYGFDINKWNKHLTDPNLLSDLKNRIKIYIEKMVLLPLITLRKTLTSSMISK